MEVPGRGRSGRPKQMCLDGIRNDLSERELLAQDRAKMEATHTKHRLHIKVENDAEED